MSFRRRSTKAIASDFTKDEAEYILLVGSETGNTFVFAKTFFKALKKEGKKVYMATLNQYTSYEKATCLIVFTSTYGDGDPPSNAHTFETVLIYKSNYISHIQQMRSRLPTEGFTTIPQD